MMTKDQERASRAWACIKDVKDMNNPAHEGKYGAWVKKFPMLVLTNGLGQALAFLRAKNKPEHRDVYEHISKWVSGEIYNSEDNQLLERLIGAVQGASSDSNIYRRATTETLAFVGWLKRFAEAELNIEEGAE